MELTLGSFAPYSGFTCGIHVCVCVCQNRILCTKKRLNNKENFRTIFQPISRLYRWSVSSVIFSQWVINDCIKSQFPFLIKNKSSFKLSHLYCYLKMLCNQLILLHNHRQDKHTRIHGRWHATVIMTLIFKSIWKCMSVNEG